MAPRDLNDPCLACEIVAGRVHPPGGVLRREGPFVLHGLAEPSPLRGWLVLTTARHVRALYDLDDDEARALGPLVVRVQRAQREALGAVHTYAMALGDALHHCHVHLVPRFADTPPSLQGVRLFTATDAVPLPEAEIESAAVAVARALDA